MRVFITKGEDAKGKVTCLYIGPNADEAREALENPPKGVIECEIFRHPIAWKRRISVEGQELRAKAQAEADKRAEEAADRIRQENAKKAEKAAKLEAEKAAAAVKAGASQSPKSLRTVTTAERAVKNAKAEADAKKAAKLEAEKAA